MQKPEQGWFSYQYSNLLYYELSKALWNGSMNTLFWLSCHPGRVDAQTKGTVGS